MGTMALTFATLGVAEAANISPVDQAQLAEKQTKESAKQSLTPNQFGELASSYWKQQNSFMVGAKDERQEWAQEV
jgi:hypothetical protein